MKKSLLVLSSILIFALVFVGCTKDAAEGNGSSGNTSGNGDSGNTSENGSNIVLDSEVTEEVLSINLSNGEWKATYISNEIQESLDGWKATWKDEGYAEILVEDSKYKALSSKWTMNVKFEGDLSNLDLTKWKYNNTPYSELLGDDYTYTEIEIAEDKDLIKATENVEGIINGLNEQYKEYTFKTNADKTKYKVFSEFSYTEENRRRNYTKSECYFFVKK
jgi:hypothetical protein